ncbi:MFS family permease [Parabacteroides sp. PF5-5]|uniref:MFS transporter n=1 Tax=unclassified Parabacteroides TaxID=2649774 RepID=UPI002476F647|nr:MULTISPECIES: MFS transporter [unclassified Parabacteroides]MDH6304449.1 MFS family permease [Parabacteroides sp. PH5-39]MDH6315398.1 MFS family permease [Parabacteroides sp. PF5-13]MDH6319108.1 MFS family permease [Parabacteroides sp. PH5-13]MDH6322838.1 MFS family permease [Parabacteroides sp. PH5-8]MDH6326590.1 MFS family permease [Parabacteroides sp. PH5-41]
MNTQALISKEKIRYAALTFFLAQGLCFSSWASRIPDIKDIFEVNYAFYWGLVLFLIPVGKFVAIPLAGYLISKLGSRIMVQISILGYGLSLFAIGAASHIVLLGIFLFCFGVFWNLCDISLNTQAIGIERMYGRTIMATFHGGWSLAACLGALIGFVMIVTNVSPFYHFSVIALIIASIVFISRPYLQEDTPAPKEEIKEAEPKRTFRMPEKLLLQLGLVGLFALIIESAMFDWSGIYFESVIQAPKSLQIGFLVFMVMMTVGRFLTNYAYRIFGKKRVLLIAGSFIFIGFLTSSLIGEVFHSMLAKVIVNSLGFMMVGLGISCMVPTIYSFVGAKSKTPVGIALTILSSISFIGSLVAPLLIGAITQAFSIRYAYLVVGLLGLCIVCMVSFTNAFNTENEK